MTEPSASELPSPFSTAPRDTDRAYAGLRRWAVLRALAPHDWLVLGYLLALNVALLPRLDHSAYATNALRMGLLLGFFLVVVIPVRLGLWRDGLLAPLGYRVALQGTVQTSYFLFAAYLPLVNPRSFDSALYALDLRLFGFEPSIELERYITPFTSEWFAFFYFCYFAIVAFHTIPIVMLVKHERILGEYTLGILFVFCVGHIFYMLVPGFGPVRALSAQLSVEFPRGFWIDTVMEAVKSGGAQKDIFPSLHTAAPTFITLFSFRNRKYVPFRQTWPIVGFFTINIIIATLFLRWHWLIDVVAGLFLAVVGWWLSVVVTELELKRRQRDSLGRSWPRFRLGRSAPREAAMAPKSA